MRDDLETQPPKNDMSPSSSDELQTLPEHQDFESFAGLTPCQEAEPAREGQRAQVLPFEKPEVEEEKDWQDSPHACGRYRTPNSSYGVEIFPPGGRCPCPALCPNPHSGHQPHR